MIVTTSVANAIIKTNVSKTDKAPPPSVIAYRMTPTTDRDVPTPLEKMRLLHVLIIPLFLLL